MSKTKTCARCGAEMDKGANGRRKYCDKCRVVVIRERAQKHHQDNKGVPRKKRKKKSGAEAPKPVVRYSIPELNRLARENKLSYGQMEAKLKRY
jgi:hypothetical protein